MFKFIRKVFHIKSLKDYIPKEYIEDYEKIQQGIPLSFNRTLEVLNVIKVIKEREGIK